MDIHPREKAAECSEQELLQLPALPFSVDPADYPLRHVPNLRNHCTIFNGPGRTQGTNRRDRTQRLQPFCPESFMPCQFLARRRQLLNAFRRQFGQHLAEVQAIAARSLWH